MESIMAQTEPLPFVPATWMSFQGAAAFQPPRAIWRSEEHTSELQSQSNLVCRLLLEKKNLDSGARQVNLTASYGREGVALLASDSELVVATSLAEPQWVRL